MSTMLMRRFALLAALTLPLALAACDNDGPMEEAGESVDEAVEDAGEAVEDRAN
ncbi:MAG TPA: hypothetical protein VFG47_14595 [Geminicoccaceae bacterium]|nr:hypothetical protein [Geminicoccaceae bacterium]